MTDLTHAAIGELSDDVSVFFAPASTDLVDGLVGEYRAQRLRIEELHQIITGDGYSVALEHFVEGNSGDDRRYRIELERLMSLPPAIASLDATYWGKALALTDVYECMPQKRRLEWQEQIRNPMGKRASRHSFAKDEHVEWEVAPLPHFEEETVRATLAELLLARTRFFSERVDGIFRSLSGEHVTNSPSAFGKRMIVANMITSYDTINSDQAGYLNDLRCVIAKFMGREEPHHGDTGPLLQVFRRRTGVWFEVDGGALRMKMFQKGTCHIEVHPDMAWRLNAILANIYPAAIPASFRTKPKAQRKAHKAFGRPLPFSVLNVLAEMRSEPNQPVRRDRWSEPTPPLTDNPHALTFDYSAARNPTAQAEAESVLAMIGGVRRSCKNHVWFEFEYSPREALDEIIVSGCVPDMKSHQFYPTPPAVAALAVELACIGENDSCLEPSAGVGGIADYLPKERTRCIELSSLHCKVLHSKGYAVTEADFLSWADSATLRFDRVVMNPPFSDGRWSAHLVAAADLVSQGGVLVAVLPASAKNSAQLPGFSLEWSGYIDNAFERTSVSVVILVARKI